MQHHRRLAQRDSGACYAADRHWPGLRARLPVKASRIVPYGQRDTLRGEPLQGGAFDRRMENKPG